MNIFTRCLISPNESLYIFLAITLKAALMQLFNIKLPVMKSAIGASSGNLLFIALTHKDE
jgi:hypothetical protein